MYSVKQLADGRLQTDLTLGMVPKSLNATTGYLAFQREKKHWQTHFEKCLMLVSTRLPRRFERVDAIGLVEFTTRRRRDEGNFRSVLEKALGDALTGEPGVWPEGRWLPDDTPEHYRFGGLVLTKGSHSMTRITLTITPKGQA